MNVIYGLQCHLTLHVIDLVFTGDTVLKTKKGM